MSDRYMTLIGSEDVRSAANTMASAADRMQMAASSMYETMLQQQRFMDDWLLRLAETLDGIDASQADPKDAR